MKGRCYIIELKVNEMTPEGKEITQIKERKYHQKYIGYGKLLHKYRQY
ncbi:MAG TPA: hypothetical protein PL048_11815 [Leptospiraceae bacterium]|nr:hypothetical protein [Leptospiraceae bacterium]